MSVFQSKAGNNPQLLPKPQDGGPVQEILSLWEIAEDDAKHEKTTAVIRTIYADSSEWVPALSVIARTISHAYAPADASDDTKLMHSTLMLLGAAKYSAGQTDSLALNNTEHGRHDANDVDDREIPLHTDTFECEGAHQIINVWAIPDTANCDVCGDSHEMDFTVGVCVDAFTPAQMGMILAQAALLQFSDTNQSAETKFLVMGEVQKAFIAAFNEGSGLA